MKKASSMIELVIAIVVMGIAMMALPMMLTTVQNNNAFAMQQEAILLARTQIGDIITYRWDENSEDSSFNVGILDTNGSSDYNRFPDANNTRRVGHVKGDKRRKFFTIETNASLSSTFGAVDSAETIPDDIDDFDNKKKYLTTPIDTNETNATLGYKVSDSNMTISVKYISDINSTAIFDFNQASVPIGTTNIKMITVSLRNSQLGDGNITLRAFSSNIGANQLLRKDFP